MWEGKLAGQLLWRVDPAFVDRQLDYLLSVGPNIYHALTWSWASVNAPQDITCGDITDKGLLITVGNPTVDLVIGDQFGLVTGGQLYLKGVLKQIELKKLEKDQKVRDGWNLMGGVHGASPLVPLST